MRATNLLAVACTLGAAGCGDNDRGSLPYGEGSTFVVGSDGTASDAAPVYADSCEGLTDEACLRRDVCDEGGAADVVVNLDGEAIEVVCLPEAESVEVIANVEGDIESTDNNAVLVLDGEDDGVDLDGDLTVDGNNVVIYGEGPEVSVIGGDVDIMKNNTVVRGVTVQGDVHITFNNAEVVYCVIEGNLTIDGNNVSVAGCDIFGTVEVSGNNVRLNGNRIQTLGEFTGAQNAECRDNVGFVDANEDGVIDDEEVGDALECA